ncbi:TPA: HNH endonuclease [Proteus mirabilis]|uniref:phosphorothioated DNA-binding restriction endonuclease n=3 Tax=Proteus mirabilis TaxID=584 RepID=UPI0018C55D83|nr:HNH endonuclease [Proteus mirabilis]MBG3109858.1 HNH endonuclease [Proteus mirabilis]MEC3990535.1 HNH endonuclease [Proteus mirabilis]MEC4039258.1 HNH endonuclease [Proteus mirabilis]MEC4067494.1 HNH endonuclease [Proteus mirabilis]MEC4097654.1 HNH endonuclease [Proteus mirabilis]
MTIWRKGDNRAPHKPLLLLLALSEYRKGHPRLFNYGNEIHQQLLELLINFGPSRREHYPNLPFWRLVRDGFWELQLPKESDLSKDNKQPSKNKLIQQNVLGGFDQESYQLLIKKPSLINKLAQQILSEHFPDNVQEVIANRLDFPLQEIRQNRDPTFRKNILRAYNYQCAICGYNLRYDSAVVGLEAAHIKWKQFGGPCTINNGLALCALHHSAFDMGAISIDDNMKLLVSSGVNANQMVEQLFWQFSNKVIGLPKNTKEHPKDTFIHWHREQVFKL